MQYFSIETIKEAIIALSDVSANWLIPTFVFAANDVGVDELVDMSKQKGTDQFLDRFFNGSLIGLPSFPSGNNLLRPRLSGVKQGFPNDYVIRQDTKMWGNLFSSRGYREMRQRGELDGEKANVRLTENFQVALEEKISEDFKFENFLIWLFAFEGFPDNVTSWEGLFDHFLLEKLELTSFKEPYRGRFRLAGGQPWPATLIERPTNEVFQAELAAGVVASLSAPVPDEIAGEQDTLLSPDDPTLALIENAISKNTGRSFLLAGPPGTGKTHLAHRIAKALTKGAAERVLFLQFHPAFGYDDFVEGFRPAIALDGNETGGVSYVLEDRHLLKFASTASQNPDQRYVIIIDELNRGDVARIFGELLTYLEIDYRDRVFTLAISGRLISLPANLVFIATANPFDRSVTDLDDALLRRFIVVMMEPDKVFLEAHLKGFGVEERVWRRTIRVFDIINEVMPSGFGHTNFLTVRTIEDLAEVWTGRIQLGLRRALFHERQRYDELQREIDALLKIDEEAEANGLDNPAA